MDSNFIFGLSICLNIAGLIYISNRISKDRDADRFIKELAEKYKDATECPMCGGPLEDNNESLLERTEREVSDIYCTRCGGDLNLNGDCKICGFNGSNH